MQTRQVTESRAAIKFDALIAGIAHQHNARCIATANRRDFEKYLAKLSSSVEVVQVDDIPSRGQLRLIDQKL